MTVPETSYALVAGATTTYDVPRRATTTTYDVPRRATTTTYDVPRRADHATTPPTTLDRPPCRPRTTGQRRESRFDTMAS